MTKVTLKDIADATGLSANSVSRALKNKKNISLETRKRVQQVAKEMGYIPNSLASSMRSGKTYSIAVIMGEVTNPYSAFLVNDLTTQLHDIGYTTLMFITDQNASRESLAVQSAISKSVDAVFLCTQISHANLRLISSYGIPFVQIGLVETEPQFCQVCKDEYLSGYIAAQHMLSKGHRRILHLTFPEKDFAFSGERLRGTRQAYKEAALPFDDSLVYTYRRPQTVRDILNRVFEQTPDFTAIIAGNDMLAWQVIEVLREKGLTVPENVAVMGFDNLKSLVSVPFSVTSVGVDLPDLTRHAIRMLMEQIQKSDVSPRIFMAKTFLVQGQTT